MENKLRVPTLRFPEFTSAGSAEGAGDWVEKRLGDIIDVIDGDRGNNYPKSDNFFTKEYCLFLSAKNITKNGFRFDNTQFISRERDKLLNKGKLKRGDIVLTTRGTVGQFALYSDTVPYCNIRINSGMVLLRKNIPNLSVDYLFKACNSYAVNKQIKVIAFGSAQPQLTVKEILKIQINLPPLPEEQKIASFIFTELLTAPSFTASMYAKLALAYAWAAEHLAFANKDKDVLK